MHSSHCATGAHQVLTVCVRVVQVCHGAVGALSFHHSEPWSELPDALPVQVAEQWDGILFYVFVITWGLWNLLNVIYIRAQKRYNQNLQDIGAMRAHGFDKAEMAKGDDVDDASDEYNWRCVFGKGGAPDGRISVGQTLAYATGGCFGSSRATSTAYAKQADEDGEPMAA